MALKSRKDQSNFLWELCLGKTGNRSTVLQARLDVTAKEMQYTEIKEIY